MADARTPRHSLVLQVPAAEPDEAQEHFIAKLAFETDPSDVHADLGKGVTGILVVDCRSAEDYAAGHVPGAFSLPYRTIEAVAPSLPKDKLIVAYCAGVHCNASTKGALQLSALGFKVKEMVGGFQGWKDEGFEVETGAPKGNATASTTAKPRPALARL
jgi:rhodanese-related sulfurtransferase